MSSLPTALRQALRAESPDPCCAYCQSLERLFGLLLEADHIVSATAGGHAVFSNLCLCCRSCNGYKWRQPHARDPQTGRRVRLFHPRRQQWSRHFAWSKDGVRILGLTATGRVTVVALRMNNPLIVSLRELWVTLRLHPKEGQ